MADVEEIKAQLRSIEQAVDTGSYRPGPWSRALVDVRSKSREERALLAGDVSRISSKLHRRSGRKTVSVATGVSLELIATAVGFGLLVLGIEWKSNIVVIAAALILTMTFQPLIKIGVGRVLGISYEYFYLFGLNPEHDGPALWYEPHVKMLYGTYLAAPRASRILLHLSGLVGSPLALWLCAAFASADTRVAVVVCLVLFWAIVALNTALFVVPLFGVTKLGQFNMRNSSGGAAAAELREGFSSIWD